MSKQIQEVMGITMEKIKEMVDVNTVVGEPIRCSDSVTIIPISKISYGFASGGSDLPSKIEKDLFGGGAGAGVTVKPLGFLVINNNDVKLLQMSSEPNAVTNLIPDIFSKVSEFMDSKKKDKKEES